ncbi:hypothetical protein F2P57_14165 [[Clostridium] symbiosum]|nr:hypothetical protein F2P57_14165 [[Clostridium] symbiosum]
MYFITTKRMLEVCFSAHPNIQYRTSFLLMTATCVRECRKTPNSGKVRTAKPAARTFPEISFERV